MIFDIWSNIGIYDFGKEWREIMEEACSLRERFFMAPHSMPSGSYPLSHGAHINLDFYESRKEGPYEAHRRFVDVQFLVQGSEIMRILPVPFLEQMEMEKQESEQAVFNEEKDFIFYRSNERPAAVCALNTGNFALLFPQDAHNPCLDDGLHHGLIKKMVIKIPVSVLGL